MFLLFDGKKSVEAVLAMTTGLGTAVEDIDYLVASGMLVALPDLAAEQALEVRTSQQNDSERRQLEMQLYATAWPIATQITASLGLRGFRLNLAVEAAMGYEQLCDLLPKIQQAAGPKVSSNLARALGMHHDE